MARLRRRLTRRANNERKGPTMLWAQITNLIFIVVGLLITANQHGKPKTGEHNFWAYAIAVAIGFTVNYFAGTYSKIFGTW